MGDAGRDLRDRAGEALLHRAVDMAAQHALDLRVARDHRGQLLAVAQHRLVHVADPGLERRVVEGDQRRLLRPLLEPRLEPGELLRAEHAVGPALDQAVERDDPDREVVDGVAQPPVRRQAAKVGKRPAHRLARVVVAGQRVVGGVQRPEQRHELGKDRVVAVVGQVARDQHDLGRRVERIEMRDRALEAAGDVDLAEGERACRQEMQVRDLRDQHRLALLAAAERLVLGRRPGIC